MVTSHSRGHEIYLTDNGWYYVDTDTIFDDSRPCKKCKCYPTVEGYDACLGHLEGVSNACCGHGRDEDRIMIKEEN